MLRGSISGPEDRVWKEISSSAAGSLSPRSSCTGTLRSARSRTCSIWEQIFEYIVEHRDRGFSMVEISYNLSIPPSTFSKTVKLLCAYGLVEKHQAENNRKNIFLRPTERGLQIYDEVTPTHVLPDLRRFFDALEPVSDEDLRRFVRAIKALDDIILPERQKEAALLAQQR